MKGLVHIYCGDGKGKTTAAVGLAIRAAGNERKVLVTRFLKNDASGEVKILKHIPYITVLFNKKEFGFTFTMTQKEREEAAIYYQEMLIEAINMAINENFDILILDEIMAAYRENLINQYELLSFLKNKPESLEVIMTGRNPDEDLISLADYVSEIKKIKHPYDQGMPARQGIEM